MGRGERLPAPTMPRPLAALVAHSLVRVGASMNAYRIEHPAPHVTIAVRREPLAAIPGFRALCSCGCSAWRGSEDGIAAWETGHRKLGAKVADPAQQSGSERSGAVDLEHKSSRPRRCANTVDPGPRRSAKEID